MNNKVYIVLRRIYHSTMNKADFFASLHSDMDKKKESEREAEAQYVRRRDAAKALVMSITPLLETYKPQVEKTGISFQYSAINDYFHVSVSFPTKDPIGRDTTYQLQMQPTGFHYQWIKEFPGKNGRVRSIGDFVKVEEITVDEVEKLLQAFIRDSSSWATKGRD